MICRSSASLKASSFPKSRVISITSSSVITPTLLSKQPAVFLLRLAVASLVAFTLPILAAPPVDDTDDPSSKYYIPKHQWEHLVGIKSFGISYETSTNLSTNLAARIRVKTELILRKAGMTLLPVDQTPEGKRAMFWFTVYAGRTDVKGTKLALFSIKISGQEPVMVNRGKDYKPLVGTTWHHVGSGVAGEEVFESSVIDAVEAAAEELANDYLRANQKPK